MPESTNTGSPRADMAVASTGEEVVSDRSRFAIFRFNEAPVQTLSGAEAVADATSPEIGSIFRQIIDAGLEDGGGGKLLFSAGDKDEGFSLLYGWFKPHFMINRHIHGQDCIYFIISGGIKLGTEDLHAGDGFFVPAETPYAYQVGEKGVEILEFRLVPATAINGVFLGTSLAPWERFLEVVKTNREKWAADTVWPLERQRTDTVA